MEKLGGRVVKGYELHELIGAGGFGAVHRAHQPAVGREVAIKIILPEYSNQLEFIRRFETEAQLVARLEHPFIVPLYDYWREPDGAYLVMRYLRGGSLRTLIDKGQIPDERILRILEQVTSALAAAHRHGVVHQDLKPDNILFDEEGNAYLADFGIAKDLTVKDENENDRVSGSPAYFAPEQIRGEQITPAVDQYNLGIIAYELFANKHPFSDNATTTEAMVFSHLSDIVPSLHEARPDLPAGVPMAIQRATAKSPDERYADVVAFITALQNAFGSKSAAEGTITVDFEGGEFLEPENPYKGLRAFQEADALDFFGREELTETLIKRLKDCNFLAVIGPSGSGKSSVVSAGVIPALRRGALPGSENWLMVEMVPGDDPLMELEAALLRIAVNPPPTLRDQLEEDSQGLLRAAKRCLPNDPNVKLVLFVDQFEEVFTMVENEARRTHFLNILYNAANEARSPALVIITMRADFYDRPLLYQEFGNLVRGTTEVVLPLSPAELERAIVAPADRVGLTLADGLVTAIVKDVGEQPGALPLMQYALTELYERRDKKTLTLQAYQDSGGVLGALARRAEELYEGLEEIEQSAARQMFLRLVTLGEGTEDTRRRVLISELTSLASTEDFATGIRSVMDVFGRYRLLTFDNDPTTRLPTVEVAHEALIRQWLRLRAWLDDSREELRLQHRLTQATEEWLHAKRDPSYLLRGVRLQQYEEWSSTTTLALNKDEKDYLEASIRERKEREAQETARKAHEEVLEKRSRDRLRLLVATFFIAALIGLGLALVAFDQRSIAQQNALAAENNAATATFAQGEAVVQASNAAAAAEEARRSAEESSSLVLATGAQLALTDSNTDLAIILGMTANLIDNPLPQAQRILAEAAYAPGTRLRMGGLGSEEGHSDWVLSVAFTPDGLFALSGSADDTLRLWDLTTGETVRVFEGHTGDVNAVALSSDGTRAVSASADGTLRLWDVSTGETLRVFGESSDTPVLAVAFDPRGARILSGGADNLVHLWDADTGEEMRVFEGHAAAVNAVAFRPNSSRIASGGADNLIIVWDIATGDEVQRLEGSPGIVFALAFSPDGLLLLSSNSSDNSARIWDVGTGEVLHVLTGHGDIPYTAAFSPDGRTVMTGAQDGSIRLWDVATGAQLRRFIGHAGGLRTVAFSPDGTQVLSGAVDNSVRLWDLQYGAAEEIYVGHTNNVYRVAVSEHYVVSGGIDNTMRLWDLNTGELLRTFSDPTDAVWGVGISPDETIGVAATRDSTIWAWNLQTGDLLYQIPPDPNGVTAHSQRIWNLAFSPLGDTFLTASQDSTIRLWDAATGEQLQVFSGGHTGRVRGIAYSPDATTIVSGGEDTVIVQWDIATGEIIRRYEGHTDWVWSAAFHPEGRYFATASSDGVIILWDSQTGQLVRRFEGHIGTVTGIDFSPDGALLASASGDSTVRLWDVETGAELRRLIQHTQGVWAVTFTLDGNSVLSAGGDYTLIRWSTSVSLDELIAWTNDNRYVRELTCAERRTYRIEPLCE